MSFHIPIGIPNLPRKRAFLRACARASQHGSTIYQGRRLSARQLGVTAREPKPHKPLSPSRPDLDRLHFLSWNAGSLTTERHRELTTWLDTPEGKQVGLVAVQETHWRGPLEYTTTRFTALHSGASRPEGGLLLLVSKSLLPAAQIQYNEVVPGRLLHARLELDPATQHPNVDVVVCYQHAWSLPKQCASREQHRDKVLAHRAELWTRLSTLVAALPTRNQLLILGDLNVDLVPEGSLVGRGTFQRKDRSCRRLLYHAGYHSYT